MHEERYHACFAASKMTKRGKSIMSHQTNEVQKMAHGDDAMGNPSGIRGVDIPLSDSPIRELPYASQDGRTFVLYYRTPPGKGPFPTIVFCHGGLGESPREILKQDLLNGAVQTRFLKKGFCVAQITRRPTANENSVPVEAQVDLAIQDTIAAARKLLESPCVERESLVAYAGSAGGAMAMGAAAKIRWAAMALGEPASMMLSGVFYALPPEASRKELQNNLKKYYNAEHQQRMDNAVVSIDAPTLLLQGEPSYLTTFNREELLPLYRKHGKTIVEKTCPGQTHGFYWGRVTADEKLVNELVEVTSAFFHKTIRRQPSPF